MVEEHHGLAGDIRAEALAEGGHVGHLAQQPRDFVPELLRIDQADARDRQRHDAAQQARKHRPRRAHADIRDLLQSVAAVFAKGGARARSRLRPDEQLARKGGVVADEVRACHEFPPISVVSAGRGSVSLAARGRLRAAIRHAVLPAGVTSGMHGEKAGRMAFGLANGGDIRVSGSCPQLNGDGRKE